MRKVRTFFGVELPYYWGETVHTVKVVLALWFIVSQVLAILYLTNFRVEVKPVVKAIEVITPVSAQ